MNLFPVALAECRLLIRLASWMTPRHLRKDWRREWEAEIWHVHSTLCRDGDDNRIITKKLWRLCRGAVTDAACLGLDRKNLTRVTRTPGFCVVSLVCLLLMITLSSGLLPTTRAVLTPLPYAHAERIATISEGSLSMRAGIPQSWVRLWSRKSQTLEYAASYVWRYAVTAAGQRVLTADVSDRFFPLLGVESGIPCAGCVLVSDQFLRETNGHSLVLDGKPYQIAGVLPRGFWFLSRDIGVWIITSEQDEHARTGVVVRLRPGVTPAAVETELHSLVQDMGYSSWDSLVDVSLLQERVRSSLESFSLALALALFATILGTRPRVSHLSLSIDSLRRGLFFVVKSALLLLAILFAGLEFTMASSITMIGGTDLLAEPLSTWLFLISCMTALSWSVHDQRMRCRICSDRLGLAAHVGCPGCLLLSWAGTEMVCVAGHGMLHVPEMPSSWLERERWMLLDDSWQELFTGS